MTRLTRIATIAAALAVLCPAAALAQFNSAVVGFNDNPDVETSREMFRTPGFSGSTAVYLVPNSVGVIDHNNSFRAAGFATEGAAAMNVFFDWVGPNDPVAWARVSTFAGDVRPNPSLHLQGKVRFKIINVGDFSDGDVGICLGIRETGNDVPMLADGGTTGDIEWVGVTGVVGPNNPTPTPALIIPVFPLPVTVEFDLATGLVTLDGVPQGGGFGAMTGDGVLSAANNRGTLEHIAFVNQSADPATRINVHIDELQFEAPVADPILPPTVVPPIIAGDPTVMVTDVNAAADRVRLFLNGGVILTESPDPNATVVFTLPVAAMTGESYTATQRVGGVTSVESAAVVVLAEPSPYGISVVVDEDGDGCSFAAPGGWEFVGASSLTTIAGGSLYPAGQPLFTDNSQWQSIDLSLTDNNLVQPWLGGDGTLDPSPTGMRKLDTIWFNVAAGTDVGPHEVFLDAIQVLGPNDVVLDTIHDFEDGTSYMGQIRGQSNTNFTSTGLSTTVAFEGLSSHRITWTYADTNQKALGMLTRVGFDCTSSVAFTDAGAKIRLHVLALGATDPNTPAAPSVFAPIVGNQSSVRVLNDSAATAVQLYINGAPSGAPIDPLGASQIDFGGLALNAGDSVSATQTLGFESDFALPQVVGAGPVAPSITSPVGPGATSVDLTGVFDVPFASASEVKVNVNGGAEIATAAPSGNTATVNLVTPLQTGDVLFATQTVNGVESPNSATVTVGFAAPVIYAAPAQGDTSIRVQELDAQINTVIIRVFPGGDPNATPIDFSLAVTPGAATFADVPVAGLTAGDTLVAVQAETGDEGTPAQAETVTVAITTAVLCDDFESDVATYDANWIEAGAANPRPVLTTDKNATVGGAQSIMGGPDTHRTKQALPGLITPTPTDPLVWNVNIYDTAGPGAGGANIFAQITNATTFLVHVGISTLASDTNFYQFRAVGNGGPNWIDLNEFPDSPQRSIGWHTFTMVHKGDFIDVYVDGILSAKNVSVAVATTPLATARIGPGIFNDIDGYYDDFCIETGAVRFGEIAPQAPNVPSIAAPIVDGDTEVTITSVDLNVTQVDVVDSTLTVIGTAGAPDPNTGAVTVTLSRSLVHLELITADATNAVGTSTSEALEVGNGNGDLLISIGIRETGDVGDLGTPGSSSGSIEWVGVSGVASGAPQGQAISTSGSWQTYTFDPTDPNAIAGFTGDGIIDGTRGTLEHLAVAVNAASPGRSAGQYLMYIDNVVNVGAGGGGADVVIENFDGFLVGDEVLFQEPTNSGSTDANLTPLPSASEVSADEGNPTQSGLLSWFFKDTTAARWARITTGSANNTPQPIIDLTQPIRMDILLLPACSLQADLSGDDTVNITDLGIMLADFGCTPAPDCVGDVSGDGATNITDLGILLAEFGQSCP